MSVQLLKDKTIALAALAYWCDVEDIVTGRALVDALALPPTLLVDDTTYGYHGVPAPVLPGEDAHMGVNGMRLLEPWENATHVQVPNTLWGDYAGSTVERSNCAALMRDYPETFVRVTGGWSSEYLALPLDTPLPQYLVDALVKLAEGYPLYDEEDHCGLEEEIIAECWESYGRDDVTRDVERLVAQRLPDDCNLHADDLVENADIDSAWHTWCEYGDGDETCCEDAVSAYFETKNFARDLAAEILAGLRPVAFLVLVTMTTTASA